jgi:hypothetical protein
MQDESLVQLWGEEINDEAQGNPVYGDIRRYTIGISDG